MTEEEELCVKVGAGDEAVTEHAVHGLDSPLDIVDATVQRNQRRIRRPTRTNTRLFHYVEPFVRLLSFIALSKGGYDRVVGHDIGR